MITLALLMMFVAAVDGAKCPVGAYTDKGCCKFPFIYKTKEYKTCISASSNVPWCSLTSNYDDHKTYGYCKEEPKPCSKSCVYPFIYKGKTRKSCLDGWCATTSNFDDRKECWIYCPVKKPTTTTTTTTKKPAYCPTAGEKLSKFVGVWTLSYTNGFKGRYTITPDGKVHPMGTQKEVGTLKISNSPQFPSSAGWYMQQGVYRPGVTEYLRLNNAGSIEIRHYCKECSSQYLGISHYCCSGTATKVGAGPKCVEGISKMAGVWKISYTNGFHVSYRISTYGMVQPLDGQPGATLTISDSTTFPTSEGWYMQHGVYRPVVTEYIRLRATGMLEIRHFCTDGPCSGNYKGIGNYCCVGTGSRIVA